MPKYAKRKDVNHNEIEEVFRHMLGDQVTDSSAWAGGAGDLFVSKGHFCVFIEIKRDSKAKYTKAQNNFRAKHPNAVWRCETLEQAIHQCKCIRANATLLVIQT